MQLDLLFPIKASREEAEGKPEAGS